MATVYDMNYLRQIEAGDSEFNKAQKADNMHNIQTNIALNGYTGNIDLANRPVVRNADGTNSTVRSMSFNEDGKEILIPTISQNGTVMNPQQAIDEYHRTGQHLGMFNSPEEANAMAQQIHNQQAQMYGSAAPQAAPNASGPAWYLNANNLPMKATQAVAQGNNPSFNAQAVTNTAIANLMKKGYSHDEAAQMLSPYITEWQNREAQEKKVKADDLMTQMGNMEFGSKDYYNAALQMYQLDPERGQMLLRGAVTPRDIWTRENRLADLADQRAYQAMYGRGGRGGGGGGGRSGGGGGGGRGRTASDPALKTLLARQKYLRAEMAGIEKLGESASPQDRERHRRLYDALRATNSQLDGYYLGYPGGSGDGEAPGILGTTKEQFANGVKNVILDDGVRYDGSLSEDAEKYLRERFAKAGIKNTGILTDMGKSVYNEVAAENARGDADYGVSDHDTIDIDTRRRLNSEGRKEADRLGLQTTALGGAYINAPEWFKNKYHGIFNFEDDYYNRLAKEYEDDDEENV